ncbi:hypothetical protein E2986_13122 [Frieseomelitta varia]|uniref:Uncharacterized protein n=1 Tax=Frieseomelitta varia TaxID=561572 RepID=A0A833SDH8_9HYME|nr:hypothetical protein E2986_13122 [Frieseomelitta varia]
MKEQRFSLKSSSHLIYVVVDEPLLRGSSTDRDFPGKSNDFNGISKASNDVEFKSEFTEVSLSCSLTDVEILQCALSVLRECDDDPAAAFRYLFVGTPPLYGRELKDTDRQMKILIKEHDLKMTSFTYNFTSIEITDFDKIVLKDLIVSLARRNILNRYERTCVTDNVYQVSKWQTFGFHNSHEIFELTSLRREIFAIPKFCFKQNPPGPKQGNLQISVTNTANAANT